MLATITVGETPLSGFDLLTDGAPRVHPCGVRANIDGRRWGLSHRPFPDDCASCWRSVEGADRNSPGTKQSHRDDDKRQPTKSDHFLTIANIVQ
jgi:hypothetical protein